MNDREFTGLIDDQLSRGRTLCVGLDPVVERIPAEIRRRRGSVEQVLAHFCNGIIAATKAVAGAFKPNTAFFECYGAEGIVALGRIIRYAHQAAPDVPVIIDAKRGDVGHTNMCHVKTYFDQLQGDAITLHSYPGKEALSPFLERKDKGCIFLVKTSNPGAAEMQDAKMEDGHPYWMHVARRVNEWHQSYRNCGGVFGATYPEQARIGRSTVQDDLLFLVPGIGTQEGDLEKSVKVSGRAVFNSSRGINYAWEKQENTHFAEAAEKVARETSAQLRAAARGSDL